MHHNSHSYNHKFTLTIFPQLFNFARKLRQGMNVVKTCSAELHYLIMFIAVVMSLEQRLHMLQPFVMHLSRNLRAIIVYHIH